MVFNEMKPDVVLSVCVIGRNEGRNLAACGASLRQLDGLGIAYETLFVDSASTDNSVAIARTCFDTVVCLAASPDLNAGAARHAGTLRCSGKWILYMDGDMELSPEILPAIASLVQRNAVDEGLCAYTENVYDDGTRDLIEYKGNQPGKPCRMIGGTSLLPRNRVLEAGNWSCALYAYEESELYSRLLASNTKVIWYDCRLVLHNTPKIATKHKLTGLLFPYGSYLGKKFYGAGQVTRLTVQRGNFFAFARLKPEPYLMLFGILLGIATLPFAFWAALLFPCAAFAANWMRGGLRSAIGYAFWQCQIVWGLSRLNLRFSPVVEQVLVKPALSVRAQDASR